MQKLNDLTKEQLIGKVEELKKVLDRRLEARFSRWVENIAFAGGIIIIFLAMFDFPWLDIDAWELTIAVSVLVAPKLFGKTVAIDLVRGAFSQVGVIAQAISRKRKNG